MSIPSLYFEAGLASVVVGINSSQSTHFVAGSITAQIFVSLSLFIYSASSRVDIRKIGSNPKIIARKGFLTVSGTVSGGE